MMITQFLLQTVWLVPAYGLVGTLITLPWAIGLVRSTGPRPAAYFNLFMTLLAFVHGTIVFRAAWSLPFQQLTFDWLQVADLNLSLAIEVSPVSLGALELITSLSLLAQLYTLGYMEKDTSLARFYGLMGFFEAALGGIALSDSLFLSYGLLEMLTVSTYLLVGFWYAQPLVVTAARDAFLTKRVGDIILLMGLVALSSYGEGLTFSELGQWTAKSPLPPLASTLIGLSLIAGPTGKCAQFPLNLWLDEAMEGPTPASIMRNSVVVSVGAYVLIKLQPVFTLSPLAEDALVLIGTVTAIGASCMAIAQIDIKRTLSHSTSAYLGLVFVAVGLGHVDIALLLLLTHAIAKALLTMSIGSVIATTNNQNVTELGGLWSRMPATTIAFLVGSASLVGLLPIGTFWCFQRWLGGLFEISWGLLALLLFVNALSAVNLMRVFRLTFLGPPQPKTRRAPEVFWPMAVPTVVLTVVALLSSLVPVYWPLWLSPVNPVFNSDRPIIDYALPLVLLSGLVGTIVGGRIKLYRAWARPMRASTRFFQDLFAYDFYLERIYQLTIVWAVRITSQFTDWFDRYVVDGAVNFLGLATVFSGQSLRYSASGQSQFYLLTVVIGVTLLLLGSSWLLGWWAGGGRF